MSGRGGGELQRATRATSAAPALVAPPAAHSVHSAHSDTGVVDDDGSRSSAVASLHTLQPAIAVLNTELIQLRTSQSKERAAILIRRELLQNILNPKLP